MKTEHIIQLLEILGACKIYNRSNKWVNCCCLFAPWKHAKGKDSTPSFSISVNEVCIVNYAD